MGTLLKDRLRQGKLTRVFCAGQLCHPKVVEIVGQHGGYDAVWLDQEHVGLTLPQSMGVPGEWEHQRLWSAIERVAKAAKAAGVHWAILPRNADHARRCVALGCRMLSVGLDVWALQRGLKTVDAEFEDLCP